MSQLYFTLSLFFHYPSFVFLKDGFEDKALQPLPKPRLTPDQKMIP